MSEDIEKGRLNLLLKYFVALIEEVSSIITGVKLGAPTLVG